MYRTLLNTIIYYVMCSSRKYPYPPQGRLTEIKEGGGKYDSKLEFLRGWKVQTKKPFVGEV